MAAIHRQPTNSKQKWHKLLLADTVRVNSGEEHRGRLTMLFFGMARRDTRYRLT
nr:MAG TPA_asm: hypothetical protein [Caudoviricetes sp.]